MSLTLTEIGLDDLPRWSPWPARLLGLAGQAREPRTPESILREYDRDKYGTLMRALDADPSLSLEAIKRLELGDPETPVAISLDDGLFVEPIGAAFDRATALLLEFVGPHLEGAASVVDLGCGYGYHLARVAELAPDLQYAGGEFAPAGRALAERLHAFPVGPVDLVLGDVEPLEQATGPVVVLLSMVLHQLPSAASAVETLARHRDKIDRVLVYDALEGAQPDSLLGLLRRRYIELNHYSWDLLEVLDAREDVELLELRPNVIGTNALLPGSFAAWRFR